MSMFIAAFGLGLGMLGLQRRRGSGGSPPSGDAPTMQFNDAANSQLLAVLEDF